MKKTVYFHIDEVARDAIVASNLKRKLIEHDIDLIYGNRFYSKLITTKKTFRIFDLYIFTSLELFRAFVPDIANFHSQVLILPTESIGGTVSNQQRLTAKFIGPVPNEFVPWREKVSAFCLWGRSRLRFLQVACPAILQKCHVVGHPRYDYRCQKSRMSYSGDEKRIRIGLLTRFNFFNPYHRRAFLHSFFGTCNPTYQKLQLSQGKFLEDRLYTEAIDLRLTLDLIQKLDPRKYEIFIRVHPREDRTAWEDLLRENNLPVKLAPWDQPFMHWVHEIDYVIGPPSTSFYDVFASGK
ncbi:MAG TPA: hypothetical protein P5270_09890, partial [Victivallales bacterium]|nr:hypothetical protein [Victivallales bacterium]